MGERIEVVNVWTEGVDLIATTKDEATARRFTAEVPEGSLTAARLRLADAEVSRRQFSAKCAEDPESWPPDVIERYAELSDAVVSAYAVVISFGSAALRTARGA